MKLLRGHDEEVIAWASQMFGKPINSPCSAFGVLDNENRLCGAAVFSDFYPGGNLELTYYGPKTPARGIIRDLCAYAFNTCKVSRVTAKTARDNKWCQRVLPKVGFKYEMTQKRYFHTAKSGDALNFVLFKRDAKRWM